MNGMQNRDWLSSAWGICPGNILAISSFFFLKDHDDFLNTVDTVSLLSNLFDGTFLKSIGWQLQRKTIENVCCHAEFSLTCLQIKPKVECVKKSTFPIQNILCTDHCFGHISPSYTQSTHRLEQRGRSGKQLAGLTGEKRGGYEVCLIVDKGGTVAQT